MITFIMGLNGTSWRMDRTGRPVPGTASGCRRIDSRLPVYSGSGWSRNRERLTCAVFAIIAALAPTECASQNVAGVVNPVAAVMVRNILNNVPIAQSKVVFNMCDNMSIGEGYTDTRGYVVLGYVRPGPSIRVQCYTWNITVNAPGFLEQKERRESSDSRQEFAINMTPTSQADSHRLRHRDNDSREIDRPYYQGDGSYMYLPVRYRSEKEYVVREDLTGTMPVTDFSETRSARITLSQYGGGKHGVWADFPGFQCGLTNHKFDIPDEVVRDRRQVVWRGNIGQNAGRGDCPRLSYEIIGDSTFSNEKVELLVRSITIWGEE